MVKKSTLPSTGSRDDWSAQIAALDGPKAPSHRKLPLTADRIVQAALDLVQAEGFQALTMRRLAASLDTGAASLYAHVRDKAALDDLLIGALCMRVVVPAPDAVQWTVRFKDVCEQLRDLYLAYPGVSLAASSAMPRNLNTLRVSEGMLGILLAAGVGAQPAAWAIDAALLYVAAYTLENSLRHRTDVSAEETPLDRDEIRERFKMLPSHYFPHTVAHAEAITSGEGHQRFDFTLDLLLKGLGGSDVGG